MPPRAEDVPAAGRQRVFLNVPYSRSYERILVALTAALVAIGRNPQLTFRVAERGEGRLRRIFELIQSCEVSIHDLSAAGVPVRFNMPFELGLACALQRLRGRHDFLMLERVPHRLDRILSDLKGIDPKIHRGSPNLAMVAVLEVLERPGGNPPLADVRRLYRHLLRLLPGLKARHGRKDVFGSRLYGDLVGLAGIEARNRGLLSWCDQNRTALCDQKRNDPVRA